MCPNPSTLDMEAGYCEFKASLWYIKLPLQSVQFQDPFIQPQLGSSENLVKH